MTFAEAAYQAMPVLSWQWTPVGDPLARIAVVGPGPAPARQPVGCLGDSDRSGGVEFNDATTALLFFGATCESGSSLGDADADGEVDFADITAVLTHLGLSCAP
jgi:hypothetical protein